MNECLDTEKLVSVGMALDWNTEDALRHLVECRRCREELERLATVCDVVGSAMPADPGFTDRVMAGMAQGGTPQAQPWWSVTVGLLVNPALAGMTALFTVGLATQTGPMSGGPAAVAVVVGAMALTFVVNRRRAARAPSAV